MEKKNLVLISYLQSIVDNYIIKAEFSTNDADVNCIVVQETSGEKIVFYDCDYPLFNYYDIGIYNDSIEKGKNTSVVIGNLIGKSILFNYNKEKWQLIFMQMSNPRAIEYRDIRRVAYMVTLKCIINKVA
jgi:hypothetical protein